MVLGGSDDGGYYLVGIKRLHRRLFEEIDWSTERVFAQTLERAKKSRLTTELLAHLVRRGRRSHARSAAAGTRSHRISSLRCEAHPIGKPAGLHHEQSMLTRQPWLTNCALALLGVSLVALCRQGVYEIHHFVIGFGLVAMSQAMLFLVAVWVVLNRPANRWTFVIIVACAVACSLVCSFSALSFHGYLPLRVGWKSTGCRHQSLSLHSRRFASGIPARSRHLSPHQPARLCAHHLSAGSPDALPAHHQIGASVRWMKAGMVGLEALTIWAVVELLAAVGLRRDRS